ncbi:MAG: glycosyltransferase family 39 protein, partial [Deltaproteobacteria bacterium]|nr:glycosyltransferase family 39 protein [Deltaproteobacteria bacterium]
MFFCALGLRLWHFFEIRHIDYITSQNTDLFQFMYYAEKMYAGTFFLQQKIFFNLLYPLFLTVVHYAAGFSIEQILLLQLTLDACSAVLVAAIVMNVSGKRAGSIAGFMYACYGPIIFYAGLPLAPCLTVFLMLISCFCLLRLIDENRPNPLWGIGAGLCFALVTIARPNSIIVLPAVLFLLWLRFRGEMKMLIRAAVILCISVVLPLVPFMVHNYATVATLSPYSLNGGINLYMGNHAGALGVMQTVEGVESSPGKQVIDSIRRASEKTGKVLSVKDANAYWVREALRFYLTDPGSGIVLL